MRIVFIAKHPWPLEPTNVFAPNSDNDDETAVAWALEQLGHEVIRVPESRRLRMDLDISKLEGDFCLCFKWETGPGEIYKLKMPYVYWHFDLIDGTYDPTLENRSRVRMHWCEEMLRYCLLGFHTDGDWVSKDGTGKLKWLMQGADERVTGPGVYVESPRASDIPVKHELLFMGMVNHGQKRAEHIAELQKRYGSKFHVLGNGGPFRRIHGRDLANLLSLTNIVIAPDGPQSDRYWSNRVWQVLGFQGFLLHPYCKGLVDPASPWYLEEGLELATYHRPNLFQLIDYYLEYPSIRKAVARAGYEAIMKRHLYRHRLEIMLDIVERKLKNG